VSYCVYILRCSDGSYYVGQTEDVEKRVVEHERGMLSAYTRKRRPVKLVFTEEFTKRNDAFERERQIKGWSRAKKEALIKGNWPRLQALARHL
jgi:predicted GIY-YIG superfamily endonuclease